MKKMMMLFVLLPLLAVGQRKFKGSNPSLRVANV